MFRGSLMKRTLVALVALCGLAVTATATAQEATVHDAFQTTQGCIYYLPRLGGERADPGPRMWSGSCTPGQPISGVGVLSWAQDEARGDFSGRMVNGSLDGPVTFHLQTFWDGAWHGEEGDGTVMNFRMGCLVTSEDCQPANSAPQRF
jgi:hypothetical protein